MSTSFDKYQKRRLISSYFSVSLSIALVLFLVGLLGLLVLNAKKIADHFKEQVTLTIYLKESAKDIEVKQLQKSLAMADYVKSTEYVSKDQAAESLKVKNGEDFMDFLGYNPLQNSIDVNLKADYVTVGKLDSITSVTKTRKFVEDVNYDSDLVGLMNDNVKKISFWILLICGIFTVIAVLLINSSIRLAVYSKRFTIKTMQMVGATKSFIRKPFVWQNIKLGIIGSVLALAGISFVLYHLNITFPMFQLLSKPALIGILFIGVISLGIIITWLSTFFATQRFLNLNTDQLYY